MVNARELALITLYKIEFENAYSNMALKDTLSRNRDLSKQDK